MKNIVPILLTLACFTLLPKAQSVSPPPDGGYPGSNTAEGQNALFSLTSGTYNTAVGFLSLRSVTTGTFNTATGAGTLLVNTAHENTATGAGALLSNTIGSFNMADGGFALSSNTTGSGNTADGANALSANTIGAGNTAAGDSALTNNTTGSDNIALGLAAGSNVTTADNVICIGSSVAGANVSNSCYIGNIRDVVVAADAEQVYIDSTGKLGTFLSSSRRFKTQIKPMDKISESILSLKPVTFRYKNDQSNKPQFGLIAEEVAEVNPDLVVRDKEGKAYTVRYEQVNAMLLNEFLKEHRKVEQLERQVEKLTAGLQKVSKQIRTASGRQIETDHKL